MRTSFFLLMSLVSAAALAQSSTDKSFSVSGASCDQVNWSDAALAKYPQIGKACQAVVERGGKYYIKFEGEVKKVGKKGEQLTVAFKGGQTSVITPPPDFAVKINDKPVPTRNLRPGDQLTFYVIQDRLADAQEDLNALLFVAVPMPEEAPAAASDAVAQTSPAPEAAAATPPAAAEPAAVAAAPVAEAPPAAPPPYWLAVLVPLAFIGLLIFLDKRKPANAAH